MKMFKKYGILCMCLAILCGCQTKEEKKLEVCDIDCDEADMTGYEGFTNEDGVFLDISMEDAVQMIEEKQTFVLYLGFSTCGWCIDVTPILNDVALEQGISVYYIDVKKEGEDIRTKDNEAYVKLENYVRNYFTDDEDKIYVPAVIGVDHGMISNYHVGTVEGHDAYERELTEVEIKDLEKLYENLIEKIK